ncbi:MAG: hypothetical protein WC556_13320 [Candidatus Methanoperedens sp.]
MIWKNNTELALQASTRNINAPVFQWRVDGKIAGNTQKLLQKFTIGEHKVALNISFGNKTLQANQSIIVIDSIDGVLMRNASASKNQWGFQTTYKGKNTGVKGVRISIDSSLPQEVNSCGQLSTQGLFSGEHKWNAQYQGKNIASGTFNLKEISEIKFTKINVAPGYMAGDTVNGSMILKNTGTSAIKAFEIKTIIINHNFEWMGDKAKKEYSAQYNSEVKPGEVYEIPIKVTIPEKVSGIRPAGSYTITVNLILNGKIMDTKAVNTEVK